MINLVFFLKIIFFVTAIFKLKLYSPGLLQTWNDNFLTKWLEFPTGRVPDAFPKCTKEMLPHVQWQTKSNPMCFPKTFKITWKLWVLQFWVGKETKSSLHSGSQAAIPLYWKWYKKGANLASEFRGQSMSQQIYSQCQGQQQLKYVEMIQNLHSYISYFQ